MKHLLNIGESILLSISIFLIVFCLTILNKNYIKFELNRYKYYDIIISDIKKDINHDVVINYDNVKDDVNNYIDSYYVDKNYANKIDDSEETREIYNKHIKFIGPYKNIRLYRDILDICTLIFIILTGLLFLKTKFKHNINVILIITGVIGIIGSFISYMLNNYTNMIYTFIHDAYHIYLGINIFILILPIFMYVKNKIVKK